MKKKPKSKRILLGIQLLCVLVLSVSGTLLARDLRRYHSERSANEKLADRVRQTRDTDTSDPDAGPDADRFQTYAELHQENPDFIGWLYIEDTRIDYPDPEGCT